MEPGEIEERDPIGEGIDFVAEQVKKRRKIEEREQFAPTRLSSVWRKSNDAVQTTIHVGVGSEWFDCTFYTLPQHILDKFGENTKKNKDILEKYIEDNNIKHQLIVTPNSRGPLDFVHLCGIFILGSGECFIQANVYTRAHENRPEAGFLSCPNGRKCDLKFCDKAHNTRVTDPMTARMPAIRQFNKTDIYMPVLKPGKLELNIAEGLDFAAVDFKDAYATQFLNSMFSLLVMEQTRK
jgi:hypothetical protein